MAGVPPTTVICPVCGETTSLATRTLTDAVDCPRCGSTFRGYEATIIDPELTARTYAASCESTKALAPGGPLPPTVMPNIAGYEMIGFVARGGMGVVVKARHLMLNRLAAVKLPLPEMLGDPGSRERFLREARAAAHLRHPNICPIHEIGETGGRPFIAMAFIEGQTLRQWAKASPPLPRRSAEMVAVLARAVGYAHEHGVVHRDIKPANVMVDAETGQPVLMDFGLAKEVTADGPDVTDSGQVLGTPAYMAPEQAAGRPEWIGPHTDVYALGAVLYDLLCGHPPFLGRKVEVLYKVQVEDPPPPRRLNPRIHRDLETICLRALSKEPAARYETAVALAEDLERFCAGEGILARRASAASRLWRKVRRNPVPAASVLAVALLLAVVGYVATWARSGRRVSALAQSIEEGLARSDWSDAHLEAMEALVGEMERQAPQRGAEARARLYDRFAAGIRDALRAPALDEESVRRAEAAIALLGSRVPDAAPALRQALGERMRAWQPVFSLAEPFGELSQVFDPGQVRADKGVLQRATDAQKAGAVVLARLHCEGNVQLEAVFAKGWQEAAELGLALSARGGGKGYQFLVRVPVRKLSLDDEESVPRLLAPSLSARVLAGESVNLEVLRDGVRLRQQAVPARSIATDALHLLAVREGDRLVFQVNDLPPMAFQDVFPLGRGASGVFGVHWPSGVGLERVVGSRQALPAAPSPLEQGDHLYAQGQFQEALAFYRQQAIAAPEVVFRQEAQHKEGMCLLGLRREEEAASAFERLAVAPGERWPLLAACELWAMRLRQRRYDDADQIFGGLSARYRPEQLVPFLPGELRDAIISAYRLPGVSFGFLLPIPNRVRKVELAAAVDELLGSGGEATKMELVRVYCDAGQTDKALEILDKGLKGQGSLAFKGRLAEEYAWLLRLQGQPQRALDEIGKLLTERPGQYRQDVLFLLLERARVRAAMGQWEEAERDVEELLRVAPPDYWWNDFAAACLLRGFLRERRGDAAGALEAWRQALTQRAAAKGQEGKGRFAGLGASFGGQAITYLSILMSLTGEVSEAEINEYSQVMIPKILNSNTFARLSGLGEGSVASEGLVKSFLREMPPGLASSVAHKMWASPRGRELARKMVFRELPYHESLRVPVLLAGLEAVRQVVFSDGVSADQEQLLWEAGRDALTAVTEGKLGLLQAPPAFLAWKGRTDLLGWRGLAPLLEPKLRGPIAYVLGFRLLRLGKRDDAVTLFRSALSSASPDSLLGRLAKSELDRLGAK